MLADKLVELEVVERISPSAFRGQKGVKVFFVPLRAPSWPFVDKKVFKAFSVPLRVLRG